MGCWGRRDRDTRQHTRKDMPVRMLSVCTDNPGRSPAHEEGHAGEDTIGVYRQPRAVTLPCCLCHSVRGQIDPQTAKTGMMIIHCVKNSITAKCFVLACVRHCIPCQPRSSSWANTHTTNTSGGQRDRERETDTETDRQTDRNT